MPNGKTHFIAGAFVGATVNVIIQSTKMAMDYDRPFDWPEFFLCAGAGAFAANPKGIASFSPGLPSLRGYPGFAVPESHNPERLAPGARTSTLHVRRWRVSHFPDAAEAVNTPNDRQLFHTILSAGLIAYAISANHTLKLSRTTRLFLWAFGMSYLSHIALDSTTPKQINLL